MKEREDLIHSVQIKENYQQDMLKHSHIHCVANKNIVWALSTGGGWNQTQ